MQLVQSHAPSSWVARAGTFARLSLLTRHGGLFKAYNKRSPPVPIIATAGCVLLRTEAQGHVDVYEQETTSIEEMVTANHRQVLGRSGPVMRRRK